MRSNAASSAWCAGPSTAPGVPPMPTLLTSTSSPPNRACASSTIAAACSACTMSARERGGPAPFGMDHRHGLLGTGQDAIHAEHVRSLAGEQHGHRPAVADGLSGRLTTTHHHRTLGLESASHHALHRSPEEYCDGVMQESLDERGDDPDPAEQRLRSHVRLLGRARVRRDRTLAGRVPDRAPSRAGHRAPLLVRPQRRPMDERRRLLRTVRHPRGGCGVPRRLGRRTPCRLRP